MIVRDESTGKFVVEIRGEKLQFDSRREAREWELQNTIGRPVREDITVGSPMTKFEELLDAFLEEKSVRLRGSTKLNYEVLSRRFIRPAFKGMKLEDITPSDVRGWQNDMMKLDYSASYLRKIDTLLVSLFNYGIKFYGMKTNPAILAGTMGSWKNEEMNFWTLEEYSTFIATVEGENLKTAFELLYWTGMRVGELLALTQDDFDFVNHTLSITKSLRRYHREDIITPPKTKKGKRTVYIHEKLEKQVIKYLELRKAQGFPEEGRLFGFTIEQLRNEIKRGCRKTGIKRIRVHDLRHSHASLLIEMNVTPLLIAERLGHEKVETTLEIYSHLYPNKQQELALRLDELDSVNLQPVGN